jgi:hypothetical protein
MSGPNAASFGRPAPKVFSSLRFDADSGFLKVATQVVLVSSTAGAFGFSKTT